MAPVYPDSSSESLPYGESAAYKQHAKDKRSVDLTGMSKKDRADDVVSKFDAKLNEINKGYLAFFSERIQIEEQYVDSLQRLYVQSRAFDSLYEDGLRGAFPTSRQAWREVRDHTEREADTRRAYLEALQESVVRVLTEVGTVHSRIRGRIKEDLERTTDMYIEQAEHTLPKLKKAYFKKCQEVEDQKRQDHAIALQAKLLSDPVQMDRSYSPLATPTNELSGMSYTSPPSMTGPLPPSANPAFVNNNMTFEPEGPTGGRRRSGSTGQTKDVLGDLATTGKRGLNAFMARFGGDKDKEKSPEEGFVVLPPAGTGVVSGPGNLAISAPLPAGGAAGHGRTPSLAYSGGKMGDGVAVRASAMKGVKLRREADEAEKAYRESVFHLESLRLRINKIQTAANESYEGFTSELCGALRRCLNSYIDCSAATAATNAQMVEHPRKAVDAIDAAVDTAIFAGLPQWRTLNFAFPILYENFYVGPCRSLIFGVSLNDYDFQRGERLHGLPPTILVKCIAELDKRGLETEGIHRINGRVASVQQLVYEIEQDEQAFQFRTEHEISVISAVMKKYCRELPEPIFFFPLADRVRYTENRESHISSNFSAVRARLSRMPLIHQMTLQMIIEHLSTIASHSVLNKMDAKNLAVIFGKALFGEDDLPKDGDLKNFKIGKDTVIEDMINYAPLLFSQAEHGAPVLPAGAALSRSGSLSYNPVNAGIGSSHTRAKLPAVVTSGIGSDQLESVTLVDRKLVSPGSATLPPGAASPMETSPRNINREFAPPPLPPRRPVDVGSMHTRRPSLKLRSPPANEMGGTKEMVPSALVSPSIAEQNETLEAEETEATASTNTSVIAVEAIDLTDTSSVEKQNMFESGPIGHEMENFTKQQ